MWMDAAQVREILPQRPPMLMIDGVQRISSEQIVAFKQVSAGEPHFNGHYPGQPIMPGVLIVEGLAQAGALLAYHVGDYDPARELLLFMTIDSARFRRPVRPGDKLDYDVRVLRRGKLWKLEGLASVGGENAVEAALVAAIRPREAAL